MDRARFKKRTRWRAIGLVVAVLIVAILAFAYGPSLGGADKWNVVVAVATLLAVIAALFLDDIKDLLHSPKIALTADNDLFDHGSDMDSEELAYWIRGRITNVGDRGVEKCRLKLLDVQGPQVPEPEQLAKITNGFLQWQGGIRDSMRLNPGESWIFDIGTRRIRPASDVVLWTHFAISPIGCNLRTPGTYTLTLAVYGDNIPSTEHTVRLRIWENDFESRGIEFPDAPAQERL